MSKARPKHQPAFVFSEHPNVANYDWRLAAVTTLTSPVRFASGTVHEVGAPVVAICPVDYDRHTRLTYNMPSVCALLLDLSHRLYVESRDVLSLFTTTTKGGLTAEDDAPLMEVLEHRMASAVFAYTAIEAFANEVIEEAYTTSGFSYSDPSPQTGKPYTLEEIERYMSLERKLCGVLPQISGVKTPKSTALWQNYAHLRTIRHFVIHPKLPDKVQSSPDAEVLWKKLSDARFRDFAVDAKNAMLHFVTGGKHPARWLFKCPF